MPWKYIVADPADCLNPAESGSVASLFGLMHSATPRVRIPQSSIANRPCGCESPSPGIIARQEDYQSEHCFSTHTAADITWVVSEN